MYACSEPGKAVDPAHDPHDATGIARQLVAFACSRYIIASKVSRLRRRPAATVGRHRSPAPHTAPSFKFDPIRTGNHQRRENPRCATLLPNRLLPRNSGPCTAQNLRLPPTTVGEPNPSYSLHSHLETNELSAAHGIPCLGLRPGVPRRPRSTSTMQRNQLTSAAACRHRMPCPVSLTETQRSWPCWNTANPGVEECLFPIGGWLQTRKLKGLWAICHQRGPDTAGGSAHHCRTGPAGGKCQGYRGLSARRRTTTPGTDGGYKCRW